MFKLSEKPITNDEKITSTSEQKSTFMDFAAFGGIGFNILLSLLKHDIIFVFSTQIMAHIMPTYNLEHQYISKSNSPKNESDKDSVE